MNGHYLEVSVGASIWVLGTLREDTRELAPSDDPTVHIVDATNELPEEKQWRRRN
jgi:hypothetical protein